MEGCEHSAAGHTQSPRGSSPGVDATASIAQHKRKRAESRLTTGGAAKTNATYAKELSRDFTVSWGNDTMNGLRYEMWFVNVGLKRQKRSLHNGDKSTNKMSAGSLKIVTNAACAMWKSQRDIWVLEQEEKTGKEVDKSKCRARQQHH